jgi:radical SAM superfamily enzyme YgiQ (UPF0313 family)
VKVLFVNSPTIWAGEKQVIYPLGLAYVATYCQSKINADIYVLDLNLYNNFIDKLGYILKYFSPDIVGIEFRNAFYFATPQVPFLKQVVQKIKSLCPSTVIIVGGSGFSLFAKEIMNSIKEIDYGIFGEGEHSFTELLLNDFQDINIKNIFYRNNNTINFSGADHFCFEFNNIPKRNWPGMELEKYNYHGLQTRRGCVYKCSYCPESALQSNFFRLCPLDKIEEDLNNCINLNIKKIFFVDTIFNVPLSFSNEIITILKKIKGIEFSGFFKITAFNKNYVSNLEKTGFKEIYVSIENINESILKKYNTGINKKAITSTTELLARSTLKVRYQFILGFPEEKFIDIIKNIYFMIKIMCMTKFKDRAFFEPLAIFPHTKLSKIYNIQPKLNKYTILCKKHYWWYFTLLEIIQKVSNVFKFSGLKLNKFK